MDSDTPNQSIVGGPTIEIEGIRRQISDIRASYQTIVRGFLSESQLEALQPIEAAAALADELRQATWLNLVSIGRSDDNDRDAARPSRDRRR